MNVSDLQQRGHEFRHAFFPPKKNNPNYLFKHLIEEVGEIAADLRNKNIRRSWVMKDGLQHPEGLGSELADTILLCLAIGDEMGLDVSFDLEQKMVYHELRLKQKEKKK